MILLTNYGREVFWPVAIILLFALGVWTGKKTAVVIAAEKTVIIGSNEKGRCSRTSSRSNVDRMNRPITIPIIR
jgi:hypothetical protein